MKKTLLLASFISALTIIALIFHSVLLFFFMPSCANSSDAIMEELVELRTSNEEMKVFLQDVSDQPSTSNQELETTLQELADLQVASDESEEASQNKAPTSDEKPKESQPKNGTFSVLGLYNNQSFAIALESTETRANCLEKPYVLPYDGYGQKRDLSFIASNANIKTVYRIDKEFTRQEGLSFNEVNGSYHIYYNMQYGNGDYFFEITTTNDIVYYVGVRYGNP